MHAEIMNEIVEAMEARIKREPSYGNYQTMVVRDGKVQKFAKGGKRKDKTDAEA
jgi:hypothetical protein